MYILLSPKSEKRPVIVVTSLAMTFCRKWEMNMTKTTATKRAGRSLSILRLMNPIMLNLFASRALEMDAKTTKPEITKKMSTPR